MRRKVFPIQKHTENRVDEEMLKWIILVFVSVILVVLSILLLTHD